MQASAGGVCAWSFEVPTGIASGKSLACSYLRHVKRCWLVQTNWKTPERWGEGQQDADRFSDLKSSVSTATVPYSRRRRTPQTALHAYFLSPKVNPAIEGRLKEMFNDLLHREYPDVKWQLMINADCTESVIKPTLESASSVADSSELFLRSVKLLETANGYRLAPPDTPARTPSRRPGPAADPQAAQNDGSRSPEDARRKIRKIKTESHRSWSDLRKAVRALLDQPHEPFGTPNVENSSKNAVRRMRKETGLEFDRLKVILDSMQAGVS